MRMDHIPHSVAKNVSRLKDVASKVLNLKRTTNTANIPASPSEIKHHHHEIESHYDKPLKISSGQPTNNESSISEQSSTSEISPDVLSETPPLLSPESKRRISRIAVSYDADDAEGISDDDISSLKAELSVEDINKLAFEEFLNLSFADDKELESTSTVPSPEIEKPDVEVDESVLLPLPETPHLENKFEKRSRPSSITSIEEALKRRSMSSDSSVGIKTLKHHEDNLSRLYGRVLIPKDERTRAVDNVIDHYIKEAQLVTDQPLPTEVKEVFEKYDPCLMLQYNVEEPQDVISYQDTTGILIQLKTDNKTGWHATVTMPDGSIKEYKTKKLGKEGFDKLVEKIEVFRLVHILNSAGLTEISIEDVEKDEGIKDIASFIQRIVEVSLSGVSKASSFSNIQILSLSTSATGDVFRVLGAMIEVKKAANMWKDYQEHAELAKNLHAQGEHDEAKGVEHYADKLRRKAVGKCSKGLAVGVSRSLLVGKSIMGLLHASKTLSHAVMATGVAAGAVIAAEGAVGVALDVRGLVKSADKKTQLKEMKSMADAMEATNDASQIEKAQILRDFTNFQGRRINSEIFRQSISLSGNTVTVAAGGALIAASVASGPALPIVSGVLLGGAGLILAAVEGVKYADSYMETKRQQELIQVKPSASTHGILTVLYFAIKAEQDSEEKVLTKTIVEGYLGLSSSEFLKMMEHTAAEFSPVLERHSV